METLIDILDKMDNGEIVGGMCITGFVTVVIVICVTALIHAVITGFVALFRGYPPNEGND